MGNANIEENLKKEIDELLKDTKYKIRYQTKKGFIDNACLELLTKIKKNEKNLRKFKGKNLFIYLCFYLRKVKYENSDVHNYHDLVIDAFNPYVGDDSKITSVHLEKKKLNEKYPKEDLDFLENTLVVIVEDKHKNDLLKALIE